VCLLDREWEGASWQKNHLLQKFVLTNTLNIMWVICSRSGKNVVQQDLNKTDGVNVCNVYSLFSIFRYEIIEMA